MMESAKPDRDKMTQTSVEKENRGEILIVDDNPENLRLLVNILKNSRYKVRPASSGSMALRSVSTILPDIILIDIDMPGMNGYEVCERLKAEPDTAHIPVIFISAMNEITDKVKAFETGGVDYISKPFQMEEVLARVETHIDLRRLQTELESQNYRLQAEIRERRQIENRLRESQTLYRNVVEDQTEFVARFYPDGAVSFANSSLCRYLSWQKDDGCGGNFFSLIQNSNGGNFQEETRALTPDRPVLKVQRQIRLSDGRTAWHRWAVRAIFDGSQLIEYQAVGADISDEKLAQRRLLQSQKLAATGEMAAGVAHEVNNPITGIINYAQILIDEAGGDHGAAEIPKRILKEANRIADIVKNLLSFARETPDEARPVSLGNIISNALSLMEKQLEMDGIRLETSVPDDLPKVYASSLKLQQVIMNLISNSRHALTEKYETPHTDKMLRLTGEAIEIDGKPFVRLIVYDQGVGIPEDQLDRICDPFFSGRPWGQGTGLGLSVSYGTIRELGGFLSFESKPGEFTRAMADLPAVS